MNPQVTLITAVSLTFALTIVGLTLALIVAFKARGEARRTVALALQIEKELAQLSEDLDKAAQRATDAARRIAWLESRNGLSAPIESDPASAESNSNPAKSSITERRHRVLSLARRGLDAKNISATLGVPHGEVDLIIGLSKVA